MKQQVLILAAEDLQQRYLSQILSAAGFVCQVFDRWQRLRRALPDLAGQPLVIVFQLGFGLEQALKQLQRLQALAPLACVLVISPHQTPLTTEAILAAGADDCLIQPINPSELVSRSQAHLRRIHTVLQAALQGTQPQALNFGPLQLFPQRQTLQVAGQEVQLTATEFKLLHLLALQPNQSLSREAVYQGIWQSPAPAGSRRLDNVVLGLRKKLPVTPLCELQTLYGAGYLLRLASTPGAVLFTADVP